MLLCRHWRWCREWQLACQCTCRRRLGKILLLLLDFGYGSLALSCCLLWHDITSVCILACNGTRQAPQLASACYAHTPCQCRLITRTLLAYFDALSTVRSLAIALHAPLAAGEAVVRSSSSARPSPPLPRRWCRCNSRVDCRINCHGRYRRHLFVLGTRFRIQAPFTTGTWSTKSTSGRWKCSSRVAAASPHEPLETNFALWRAMLDRYRYITYYRLSFLLTRALSVAV